MPYVHTGWPGPAIIDDERPGNSWFAESYHRQTSDSCTKQKEEPKMKVKFKGTVGELMKLERFDFVAPHSEGYKLEIYDTEKKARVCFDRVALADIEFIGASVKME